MPNEYQPDTDGLHPGDPFAGLGTGEDEVKPEGDVPAEPATDDPGASSAQKEEGTPPSQEGGDVVPPVDPVPSNTPDATQEVPFHTHPRWVQKMQEIQELRDQVQQLSQFKQGVDTGAYPTRSPWQQPTPEEQPPAWFQDVFGADQNSWKQFNENASRMVEARIQQTMQAQQQAQAQAQAYQTQYQRWIDDSIDYIMADGKHSDVRYTRDELKKVLTDYNPTRVDHNTRQVLPDFDKAYQILTIIKRQEAATTKQSVDARKQVAGTSGPAPSAGGSGGEEYKSAKDLRSKSFSDLVHGS